MVAPFKHIELDVGGILEPFPSNQWKLGRICRHCEERRDEAIHCAAKQGWIASSQGHLAMTALKPSYSGNSGSRRALRFAVVAEADAVERTKLQRTLEACRESCRITIWAVRRGGALAPRNTLPSTYELRSSACTL